jgi:hypothetical protein
MLTGVVAYVQQAAPNNIATFQRLNQCLCRTKLREPAAFLNVVATTHGGRRSLAGGLQAHPSATSPPSQLHILGGQIRTTRCHP